MRSAVRDLQPGDVLIPTGRIVVRTWGGVKTPPGRLEVELEYPKTGHRKTFTYNRDTRIPVKREEAE